MPEIIYLSAEQAVTIKLSENRFCGLYPGEFDRLKKEAPELYEEISKIWTPEVVKHWEDYMKEIHQLEV